MTELRTIDPLDFARAYWPGCYFYDKQRDVIYSVRDSVETYVTAGNQLGKDFVAGYIALSFFINPTMYFDPMYVASIEAQRSPTNKFPHSRRVVTTSVKDDHLRILWAEISRFVTTCTLALDKELILNHHEIRMSWERGVKHPMNYLIGQVTEDVEGMSGHHAAYTLMVGDEASGIEDAYLNASQGWAKRFLFFGNPNPCSTFFFKSVMAGDLLAADTPKIVVK